MRPSSGKACSRTSGVPAPLVAAGGAGSASGSSAGGSAGGGLGVLGCGGGHRVLLGGGPRGGGPSRRGGWGLEAEGVEEPGQQAGGEPPDQDPVGPEHGAGEVGGDAAGGHRLLADDGAEREGPVVGRVGQLAQGRPQDPGDLVRVGHERGQAVPDPDHRQHVEVGHGQVGPVEAAEHADPRGSRPTSSSASRRAAATPSASPGSTAPPGRPTWPACWRRWSGRRTRTISRSSASSTGARASSTDAGTPLGHRG